MAGLGEFNYPGVELTPETYYGLNSQWQTEPSIQKSDDIDGIVADAFVDQGQSSLTGLGMNVGDGGGLATPSNDGTIEVLKKMYSGEYARQIRDADAELTRQNMELTRQSQAVAKMSAGSKRDQALALIKKGRDQIFSAREKVIEAKYKYNFIRSEVSTFVSLPPVGLSNLGNPLLAIPLAKLATIAVIAAGLYAVLSALSQMIRGGNSLIGDVAALVRETGVATSSTFKSGSSAYVDVIETSGKWAVIAAIGVGAYFLLKKKGVFA